MNKVILKSFKHILVDVYLNGVYQGTVCELGHLDLRRQVVQHQIEGYSLKINPKFHHLFKKSDEIEDDEMFIGLDGVMSDWFTEYNLEDYGDVKPFQENIKIIHKMQKLKNDSKRIF
jgi:hypothetical protein